LLAAKRVDVPGEFGTVADAQLAIHPAQLVPTSTGANLVAGYCFRYQPTEEFEPDATRQKRGPLLSGRREAVDARVFPVNESGGSVTETRHHPRHRAGDRDNDDARRDHHRGDPRQRQSLHCPVLGVAAGCPRAQL